MPISEPPISLYRLASLQAYLYRIFSMEKKCENTFENTKWYLNQMFSKNDIEMIFKFFHEEKLTCDCDILKKLDLRKLSNDKFNFHN